MHEEKVMLKTSANKQVFLFIFLTGLLVTKKRRQSPYASRFTTNHHQIWEVCARMGTVPILMICFFTCGGDCEAIEQYVLERVALIQMQK